MVSDCVKWRLRSVRRELGQLVVEPLQGRGEPTTEGVDEVIRLQWLPEFVRVGKPVTMIRPIRRKVVTGIPVGVGARDPHLFTLERPLQLVQDAEFIIATIDLGLPIDLSQDMVAPLARYDTLEGHGVLNTGLVASPSLGWRPALPQWARLEHHRHHSAVMVHKLPMEDLVPDQTRLGATVAPLSANSVNCSPHEWKEHAADRPVGMGERAASAMWPRRLIFHARRLLSATNARASWRSVLRSSFCTVSTMVVRNSLTMSVRFRSHTVQEINISFVYPSSFGRDTPG